MSKLSILKSVLLMGAATALIVFFSGIGWSAMLDVNHLDVLAKALLAAVDIMDIVKKS